MRINAREKNKYLLTLRLPFDAFDNLDARLTVRTLLDRLSLSEDEWEHKLQRVYKDKEPEKVLL